MGTTRSKGFQTLSRPDQRHTSPRSTEALDSHDTDRSLPIPQDEHDSSGRVVESHGATVARLTINRGMPIWFVENSRDSQRRRRFIHTWQEVLIRPTVIAVIVLIVLGALVL